MKKSIIMKIMIITMVIFSLSNATYAIQLTVNPTSVSFGNVVPDGSSYYNQSTLVVKSSTDVDLYVKVNGPFSGSNGTIPLQYFKYQFNNSGNFNNFDTTSSLLVANLYKPSQGGPDVFPINYMLTVPMGTNIGNYTTIVTYSAVDSGSLAPQNVAISQSNNQETINNITSNSTNPDGSITTLLYPLLSKFL